MDYVGYTKTGLYRRTVFHFASERINAEGADQSAGIRFVNDRCQPMAINCRVMRLEWIGTSTVSVSEM